MGIMKSYRLFKETVGGYDKIGATAVDFKNFRRDLKAYIAGGDAQMVIDKLFRKHETCSAFHFEYDVDDNDQLTRLFWCDPVARKNYAMFGDVVSFDATYETNRYNMIFAPFTGVDNHQKCITFVAGLINKEDDESYAWLFRCFLNAMGISKLNAIVWSHYLEPADFVMQWQNLMAEYNLESHKWFTKIFQIRTTWIPAYFRDLFMGGLLRTTSRSESENSFFDDFTGQNFSLVELLMQFESAMDSQRHKNADYNADDEACYPEFKTPLDIEKHASSVYTLTIFYDVQAEICAACFSCRVLQVEELDDQHNQYLVKDNRGMTFTVRYSRIQGTATCSCKHYMRIGLLCRHIFLVFKDENIRKIPDPYINPRWCKTKLLKPMINIPDIDFDAVTAVEGRKTALNRLWSDIHYCVAAAEQKPDLFDGFSKVIQQQKNILQNALQSNLTSPQDQIFESFYGASAPSNITVRPPQQVHNKGGGKRIKSALEISIEQGKKNKRMFKTCREMGFHDSRNCPLNKQ
ncbi:unnamed protein product [Cuscuta campestris]|uniref:SWIM-type domain-containing protein n=1 Tax=Cuscuta campestris TaxID=132261 RepID=A0A484K9G2_9ASTE|nr:unnamed protein product [Cuscuta campestris]